MQTQVGQCPTKRPTLPPFQPARIKYGVPRTPSRTATSSFFRLAEFIRGRHVVTIGMHIVAMDLHVVAMSLHFATMVLHVVTVGLHVATIGLYFVDVFLSVIVLVRMIVAILPNNVEQSPCSTYITRRVIYFFSGGGGIWPVFGESIRLGDAVRGVFEVKLFLFFFVGRQIRRCLRTKPTPTEALTGI